MISYETDQRRSVRWTGSNWMEEALTASGVGVNSSSFTTVTGANAHVMFDAIDNVLEGNLNATATGIVMITDVSSISGTNGEILDNLDVLTLPSGSDSAFRFSFCVPAQPTAPVKLQLSVAPRGATSSGNLKLNCSYNIFERGSDITPGGFGASLTPITQSLTTGDFEKVKLLNFSIPQSEFSASGSAPFIVNCRIGRDISVTSNYSNDVSIAQIIADNVPGGIIGNIAGYTGGNLIVTGDLTMSGNFLLGAVAAPAASGSSGLTGSLVLADDYLYACVASSSWKRININAF